MADGGDPFEVSLVRGVIEIDAAEWNSLAAPLGRPTNPFVSFEFLAALECSGSVGPGTGWEPQHLTMRRGGRLVGAAPLYCKTHSLGEYVFDHHWADAYSRAGGRYYPKLLCAPPFSPVPGPRLLVSDDAHRAPLAAALVEVARRAGHSSLHANFLTREDDSAFVAAAALQRTGVQYHWFNRGYRDFEDFIDAFASRKRKQVRRERREAVSTGISVRRLIGKDATSAYWDAFWDFYQDTGSRKWGQPYLTRTFFQLLVEAIPDRILLIVAERAGRPVGGALNLIGDDALYGRYWGAIEHHPYLHFELCYYQAIEFAIERGLARVEAGAQGEHKLARGYEPVKTRSAHWIADLRFREAVGAYLARERAEMDGMIASLSDLAPYRKDPA